MAFWGIQVRPEKPFTLFQQGLRKRLHISQATLAIGSSNQTSFLQCNVGDKSPVLLCALLPDKSESLQLNLEFDELEEVVFSVIGPRGVYLTGFYTGVARNINDDDESESYGEDIGNSENEESGLPSDEDEYEDSFIDDDDNLEVLPPSPVSSDGVDDDIDKQRNKTNTNKRLKKRSQVTESDDESISWQQNTGNCIRVVLESESEDGFPISSVRKNIKAAKNIVSKSNACSDASKPMVDGPVKNDDPKRTTPKKRSKGAASEGKTVEADATNHSTEGDEAKKSEAKTSSTVVGQDPIVTNDIVDDSSMNKTMPKKKGKRVSKKVKTLEAEFAHRRDPDDKVKEREAETNNIAVGEDPIITNEIGVDPDTNKISNFLPSPELGCDIDAKPKKKRKERSGEKILEENTDNHIKSFEEKKYMKADMGADDMDQDLHVGKKHDQREAGLTADTLLPTVVEGSAKPKRRKKVQDQKTPTNNDLDVPGRKADENTSEKTAKKKKNKSKVQKDVENMDLPVLLKGENENSINEVQEQNLITGLSKVRTLSNGLVIKDLESNKSDGKAAAPGKKLKVQYTAKLKENGEIIDSNGKAPYRFRLGDENVMEGWNIGLDGMCAGDKRRLIVPPSLRNGSRGTVENVPPDSWVIYDVEVLRVN